MLDFVLLALIFGTALYVLLIHPRLIERKTRGPLSEFLDRLIAQVKDVDKAPLRDLGIHTMSHDDGRVVEEVYWVYPDAHTFMFRVVWEGATVKYVVGYDSSRCPGLTTPFSCRSWWFVSRMTSLSVLLNHYPRERALSDQVPDPPPEDAGSADRPAS